MFQHRLRNIRKFQHELTVKIIVGIFIKFNLPVTLYVLFCKDLMVNVENSSVRTFMLFPKHVTMGSWYWEIPLVFGNLDNTVDYYIVMHF